MNINVNKLYYIAGIGTIAATLLLIPVTDVAAQNKGTPTNTQGSTQTNTPQSGIPKAPASTGDVPQFNSPIKGDLQALIQRIVNVLLSIVATIAIIFIIVGGFRLAFSQGSKEAIEKGKKTITWAIAGLVLALLTFALINIVIRLFY